MMTATQCPSTDQLRAYSLGQLSDGESNELFEHLRACNDCDSELETLGDGEDSLIASLRHPNSGDGIDQEPNCQRAVAKALGALALAEFSADASTRDAETDDGIYLPQQIGEYEIVRPLGRGGMGNVYLARHTKLGREVALKVLANHRLADHRMRERFEAEMRAVGRLSHPNIVTAHDAREVEGTAVLVTEYIDGLDLGQLIQRTGPLNVADACEIVRRVAVALQYTHEQGFVHRDVKPSNVMLSKTGEVKLLDLGLARIQSGHAGWHSDPDSTEALSREITATGQAMGTADYVAPEQVTDSRRVDIRADIYALGCTLFKLLSGHAPFASADYATPFAKMTAHVTAAPPNLRDIVSSETATGLPEPLVRLVTSMLAKHPDNRPQTPSEIASALSEYASASDLDALITQAVQLHPISNSARPATSSPSRNSVSPQGMMKRRIPTWITIASGLGGLFFGLLLGVLITIKFPDGTTTQVVGPDGTEVTVAPTDDAPNHSLSRDQQSNASVPNTPPDAIGMQALPKPLEFAIAVSRDHLTDDKVKSADGVWSQRSGVWVELSDDVEVPIETTLDGRRHGLFSMNPSERLDWEALQVGVESVSTVESAIAQQQIELKFRPSLSDHFHQLTSQSIGRKLGVIIHGKVNSAPRIQAAIHELASITGSFTAEEIRTLHRGLQQMNRKAMTPYGLWKVVAVEANVDGGKRPVMLAAFNEDAFYVVEPVEKRVRKFAFQINTKTVPNQIDIIDARAPTNPIPGIIRLLGDGQLQLCFDEREGPRRPGSFEKTNCPVTTLERVGDMPPTKSQIERLGKESPDLIESLNAIIESAHSNGGNDLPFVRKAFNLDAPASLLGDVAPMSEGVQEEVSVRSLLRQKRESASHNLKQLGLAFHNFHETFAKFPGSRNTKEGGLSPWNGKASFPFSWRVAVLPFIEQADLFQQYRFDEAWDSEHNSTLLNKMPAIYRSPFAPDNQPKSHTNYVGFTTEEGGLGNQFGHRIRDFTDGTSNTILVVESKDTVPWTKPEDLTSNDVSPLLGDSIRAVMADASVVQLDLKDQAKFIEFITKDGGEPILVAPAILQR